jgi:hypothetical protein
MPVIEGWRELSLSDDKIGALLLHDEGYYDSLRRYRNSIFHYQREFFGPKQSEWYEKGQKMVLWVILLHSEFSRVYREIVDNYPATPEDAESIRKLVGDVVGWLPRTSQDVARDAKHVEQYLDEQLQRGTLSDPSRRRASVLKADVGALSSKSTEALADLAALREVWRSHIFEEQAPPLTSRSIVDTPTDTDRD